MIKVGQHKQPGKSLKILAETKCLNNESVKILNSTQEIL